MKRRLSIVLAVILTTLLLTSGVFAGTVTEGFEWGNDGDSLITSGGDVNWEVFSNSGIAEIDTAQKYTGTKSARFYRGNSGYVYAYYYLHHPSYIGFWVKKDDTSWASIYNGDGAYSINVEINWKEEVRYYDNRSGYHTVCKVSPNTWYHIELKNINWGAHTYDIYVNGSCKKLGATMCTGIFYTNYVYFAHRFLAGEFWIDDITSLS